MHEILDPAAFITTHLRLAPVPAIPEISLYLAHPGSGLWRIADDEDDEAEPPYWAYVWAGGAVLARHILDNPPVVAGKRVLDLGAGGGIVAIAAARAGAREVLAAEVNPFGRAALALNAVANGVSITVAYGSLVGDPPPDVDLIAAGDVFYDVDVARRMTVLLDRCAEAGIDILVGDPGRAPLPVERLQPVAQYLVPDFGDPVPSEASRVFAWTGRPAGQGAGK